MSECPKPMVCGRCGGEGHMVRDCTEEEKTRTYTNEDGEEREIYIPKAEAPVEDLFDIGISVGINFEKHQKIPVKVTGPNPVKELETFESAKLRPLLMENIKKSKYKVPTPIQKYSIPILLVRTISFQIISVLTLLSSLRLAVT